MIKLHSAIFAILCTTLFGSTALAVGSDWSAKCHAIFSEGHFKAKGSLLAVLTKPEFNALPAMFFCRSCAGGMVVHAGIFEDGSVGVFGLDHITWSDRPKLHAGILADAIEETMRYVPPTTDGKSVCVTFDASWSSKEPLILKARPVS